MTAAQHPEAPVFIALTAKGRDLAARLSADWPGSELHGLAGRAEPVEIGFTSVAEHLRELFAAGRPIVGICAAGVLIRTLAPLLSDKHSEPAVLALAEDGSAVVPLLGGHRGANEIARRLAESLGIEAAVTTAGDRRFSVALDAPPKGWRLGNPEHYKAFVASALSGEKIQLEGSADWISQSDLPLDDDGTLTIRITEQEVSGSEQELIFHPQVLALGVGCERNAEPEELLGLVRQTLAAESLAAGAVAAVVSIDVKADEPAVHAVADALVVPARFFAAEVLEAETPRLATPSDLVFREVGCHGVSEGAALAAAGPTGHLIQPKVKSARATCAIARSAGLIDAQQVGRARGSLAVIGLGPGNVEWRAPEVEAVVRQASDLVGYGLYLDLLGPLAKDKICHDYALGEEEARVRAALDLAAEGRDVALICSGDPGIYAMAALVYELLDRADNPAWLRVEQKVVPGISALQAAAARIGAPLGHDFCAISLSDLLTPWEAIEQRLKAAAEGDFVVAFYNPVSKRRTTQLARAVEILSAHRPADTPVVLGRNLGRPGERVTVLDLADLTADKVDMLTVVLVGASTTRRVERSDGSCWVYTPRGYAKKMVQLKASGDAA
ncbi:precorrin-3B C(17)-methyltransferase [Denitrobaculum tricleocarpae]|uniref:Precorrin-3B C(17)-methyltransferase n=1 Tax=Denitrobaculum tricleocarpae TaxID=2591009 RepID=A0A545TMH6_9PROT|nr:precorrin-3B C(17)-methyltransferase [Denitrobaculum tricleocarpae]TQV78430.1 precorrin-3B C(17)-methyltransferase [Denitrobaculum tricleocarpae]